MNWLLQKNQWVRADLRLPLAVVLLLGGCSTTGQQARQLERVAKDWSMVVRASQILPVYPLTEDLQPGDVFLVQTPIEEQVRIYQAKGFLPFDQHVIRLRPASYSTFYDKSYGIGDRADTPRHWQFGDNGAPGNWTNAPRAAFPSYSFSVKRGGGINLALPLQGVPLGLSMLGGGSATGSIAISDAYTYGIDMYSLAEQLEQWAGTRREFLKKFSPVKDAKGTKKYLFLRVVSRVYLTRGVNISMTGEASSGGAASGGSAKDVQLPDSPASTDLGNGAAAGALRAVSQAALPGGSLKVSAKSARSVSLVETFARPLVIGYLAFDIPVLEDGQLGSPEPTHARLSELAIIPSTTVSFQKDPNSEVIQRWLTTSGNRELLQKWLQERGIKQQITQVVYGGGNADLRQQIVEHFKIQ